MKKRMLRITATISSLLLLLSFVLMPMVASALPKVTVPTPSGAAYTTSYEDGVYTVDLDAAYLSDLLSKGQLTKEDLKEVLPEQIYNLLIDRDAAAVKSVLFDLIDKALAEAGGSSETNELIIEVAKQFIEQILGSDSEPAPAGELGVASFDAAAAPAFDLNSMLDKIPDDFVINADNLGTLLDYANQMIDNGVIKVEDLENVVKSEELKDILDIPEHEEAPKIEDILAGKHNDQIIDAAENKDITAKDYKDQVIDKDELAKVEVSYDALIDTFLGKIKDKIVSLISKIEGVRLNGTVIFADAKLNVAAAEQAILNAIPTIEEVAANLAAEGEYAELLNIAIDVYDTDLNLRNYKLQVRFAGSKDDRADLQAYAEKIAQFVAYDFDESGDIAIKLNLPKDFVAACVTSVDEEKLPTALRTALGDVAELDFSDKANTTEIVVAIINNFSIGNYADFLALVDVSKIDADLADALNENLGLTVNQFDTVCRYIVRAVDKAYALADKYTSSASDAIVEVLDNFTLAKFDYVGNGEFAYDGVFKADTVDVAEKALSKLNDKLNGKIDINISKIPDYVLDSLSNTVISHNVVFAVDFEDLSEVEYVRNGDVVDSYYAFAGDALKAGWADANLSTVVPAVDTKVAELRTVTFERYYVKGDVSSFDDSEKVLYNELSNPYAVRPTEPVPMRGYGAWTWDYDFTQGLPLDRDITITGTSEWVTVSVNTVVTVFGSSYDLGFSFDIDTDVYTALKASPATTQIELAHRGFRVEWYVIIKDSSAATAALTAPEGAILITPGFTIEPGTEFELVPVLVSNEYTVEFKYDDNTFKATLNGFDAYVDGDPDNEFSVELLKAKLLSLAPDAAKKGYTYEWKLPELSADTLADPEQAIKIEAEYTVVEYDISLGYITSGVWNDFKSLTFTVENYADVYSTINGLISELPFVPGYVAATAWVDLPADYDAAVAALEDGTLKIDAVYTIIDYIADIGYYVNGKWTKVESVGFNAVTFNDNVSAKLNGIIKNLPPVKGYAKPAAWNGAPADFLAAYYMLDGTTVRISADYTLVDYVATFMYGDNVLDKIKFNILNYSTVMQEDNLPVINQIGYDTKWSNIPAEYAEANFTVSATPIVYTAEFGYELNGAWVSYDTVEFTVENFADVFAPLNLPALPEVEGYKAIRWNTPHTFADAYAAMTEGKIEISATLQDISAVTPPTVTPDWPTIDPVDPPAGPGTVDPGTSGDDDEGGFPWWIVIVALAVILVALLLVFVFRKKKDDGTPTKAFEEEETTDFGDEDITDDPDIMPIVEGAGETEEEIELVDSVDADSVDKLMTDATAEHLIESAGEASGTGKMGIVNVGVISDNFADGDVVDIEALKAKGLLSESMGRVKVLAAGTLNKHLTVKADAFSVQAIKMIALTGGHAMKLGEKVKTVAETVAEEEAEIELADEVDTELDISSDAPVETEAEEAPKAEAEEAPEAEAEEAPEAEAEEAPEAEAEEASEAEAEEAPEAEADNAKDSE